VRDRALVTRGRCLPYGEGITYWPVAEIVRQAAGIEDGDSAEAARERIDTFVAGLPEAAAIARGLVGLIGLEASAGQEELVWAFRRALEHLAGKGPLVVLVDDIHWAEPTLLDLIESVADLARDSPILFVCPARPEFLDERPTWGGGKLNATTILLEPLAERSALALMDALVPGGALPQAVRSRIADAAEGNPLYIEEFLGTLIDDGALVVDQAGWMATRDLDSIAVPPTIQALLSARLDRLAPAERAAAERASIVGRIFDQPAVVALSPAEGRPEVPRNLLALVRKELIRPDRSGFTQGDGFRFRHMLIRDAAYERLPKSERAELHELFAGWLDTAAGDRRSEVEEMIGYHLEQAFRYREELAPVDGRGRDLARRAAQRLIVAGGRALERSDIAATANLYGRGAALLEPNDPARLAILPDLGRVLDSDGRFDDSKACMAEALTLAEAAGEEHAIAHARVLQYLIGDAANEASADDIRRVAEDCSAVFARHADDRGLALALRLRGLASWKEGNVAGDEVALAQALDHARRAGSHWEETSILAEISIDLYWGPTRVPEAIQWCNDILAGTPDDRGVEMPIAHALAHMHARLGEFDLARSLAARCLEIAAESGQRSEAALLTEVAADVETLAGNHEAAERILARGSDWFVARGQPQPVLHALHVLTQVACQTEVDTDALAIMVAPKKRAVRALLETALAAAYGQAGRLDEAEQIARSAVAFFATTDFSIFHGNAAVVLGDVLRLAGRPAEADPVFRKALELYREKGSVVDAGVAAGRLAS
jgi:tetratricopeptide (TPR) repeat protein